jgi:hypothetical protein
MTFLKCDRCLHEWTYNGKRRYNKNYPVWVICPNCRKGLKLPSKEEENKPK